MWIIRLGQYEVNLDAAWNWITWQIDHQDDIATNFTGEPAAEAILKANINLTSIDFNRQYEWAEVHELLTVMNAIGDKNPWIAAALTDPSVGQTMLAAYERGGVLTLSTFWFELISTDQQVWS